MSRLERRPLLILAAALIVGLAIWAIGRLRPGIDGQLARHGGTVVPILFDRTPAVAEGLERFARTLDPAAEVYDTADGPLLVLPPAVRPGPGFRPPRTLPDGRRAYAPTPDRAERWRKRAFNGLVERLDARIEALPAGRGQATLPGGGALQLELTTDAPLAWLPALLSPGRLTLWRADRRVADHHDVVRAEVQGSMVRVAVRAQRHPGAGPIELRLDGVPLARGRLGRDAIAEVPLLPGLTAEARAQAAMRLQHGPLPLPVRAGALRTVGGTDSDGAR